MGANLSLTAVVLSKDRYNQRFEGIETVVHRSIIRNAKEFQIARFESLAKVRTKWFFYLDDDDSFVPEVAFRAVQMAEDSNASLAYTDERINDAVRVKGPYTQEAHLRDSLLLHHLVACRTNEARRACCGLPRGHYSAEFLLYWQLAKSGAAYVPEVGYQWNRKPNGMSNWPDSSFAQMQAKLWCKRHP